MLFTACFALTVRITLPQGAWCCYGPRGMAHTGPDGESVPSKEVQCRVRVESARIVPPKLNFIVRSSGAGVARALAFQTTAGVTYQVQACSES